MRPSEFVASREVGSWSRCTLFYRSASRVHWRWLVARSLAATDFSVCPAEYKEPRFHFSHVRHNGTRARALVRQRWALRKDDDAVDDNLTKNRKFSLISRGDGTSTLGCSLCRRCAFRNPMHLARGTQYNSALAYHKRMSVWGHPARQASTISWPSCCSWYMHASHARDTACKRRSTFFSSHRCPSCIHIAVVSKASAAKRVSRYYHADATRCPKTCFCLHVPIWYVCTILCTSLHVYFPPTDGDIWSCNCSQPAVAHVHRMQTHNMCVSFERCCRGVHVSVLWCCCWNDLIIADERLLLNGLCSPVFFSSFS